MYLFVVRAVETDLIHVGVTHHLDRRIAQLQGSRQGMLDRIIVFETPFALEALRYLLPALAAVRDADGWYHVPTDQEAHEAVVTALALVSGNPTPWYAVKRRGRSFDDAIDVLIGKGLTESDFVVLFKRQARVRAVERLRAARSDQAAYQGE